MDKKLIFNLFLLFGLAISLSSCIMTLTDIIFAMNNNGIVTSDYNYYGEMKFEFILTIFGVVMSILSIYFLSKNVARGIYIT